MSDIVSSIKTDEKGEAIIDLNEIETGDYTVSASFSQTNQYEAQTTSKDYYVFNGYFTRVKINGTVISNSTIITAQFNDNTLLTFSLEYSEDETNWAVKNNWNIIISVNGQTYTVTSSNPTLDLTLLNAAEHTVNINYPGDTNYYSSTYNITYKQTKNTPTLTATDLALSAIIDFIIGRNFKSNITNMITIDINKIINFVLKLIFLLNKPPDPISHSEK